MTGQANGPRLERYLFRGFCLDCRTRELWRGDEVVPLTPKAFDLLRVLLTTGDRVVEKTELIKLVWPDSFVGEDSLTHNIATLRKALGDSADRPEFIATVPRHGYRFIAPVRVVNHEITVAPVPDDSETISTLRDGQQDVARTNPRLSW